MSAHNGPPSINDVAMKAGVSSTTVSHVISGKRPVSDRTAALVQRAMSELGYVPNHAARSLRLGITRSLGLLVPDISNPYFAELAKGAEDAGEAKGYNLVLCNTSFDPEREARYLDVLRGGGVDGMIYAAGAPPAAGTVAQLARTFPLIIVDEELAGVEADTVVSDNERGGRLAGAHLRDLGHREVLVINGPADLASTPLRARGFRSAFADAEARLVEVEGDYRAESATLAVQAALRGESPWFTAVFAANDLMALAAIEVLTVAGIQVPHDVSVVGYDDTALAALVRPALTSVRQPVYRMGTVAAERLAERLSGAPPRKVEKLVLDVELVVRQTSVAARRDEAS
jgi:LacI family transcriptional regulator, galactose operon repressor